MNRTAPQRRGFTLVEIIMVIAIIAILLTMVGTFSSSATKAMLLTGAGDSVYNKLVEGQQLAISRNSDVEVRFYSYDDTSEVGGVGCRAVAFLIRGETGAMVPLGAPLELKSPVQITRTGTSLGNGGTVVTLSTLLSGTGTIDPDSPYGTSVEYHSYRYRPDGSTDLSAAAPGGDTWHLTLIDETDFVTGESSNFYTIRLDPRTGRLYKFRPQ